MLRIVTHCYGYIEYYVLNALYRIYDLTQGSIEMKKAIFATFAVITFAIAAPASAQMSFYQQQQLDYQRQQTDLMRQQVQMQQQQMWQQQQMQQRMQQQQIAAQYQAAGQNFANALVDGYNRARAQQQ